MVNSRQLSISPVKKNTGFPMAKNTKPISPRKTKAKKSPKQEVEPVAVVTGLEAAWPKKLDGAIRRKFLLVESPKQTSPSRGVEIEQGYIVRERGQELRVRRVGNRHYLSARDRSGPSVTGQEIPITKQQFEKLWPFTQGQRITRIRHVMMMDRFRMKIDEFTGEHAPLHLAEVFFPNPEVSKSFKKPDFLGEEVTRREEYETAEMAIHGAPEPSGMCQLGILPYMFKDRKLHLLLVTSSSGNRWILPKGRQEPDMTPHEVAIMEAVEEAGVLGTLRQDLRTRCQMIDGRFLQLYAMKISKLLKSWPEMNVRRRRLFPISDALEMIGDPGVAKAVRRLAAAINK
jgi:CYTH domain-containing protein/ADP-ribose pyrophosphatase YjhB (NUDIX family)